MAQHPPQQVRIEPGRLIRLFRFARFVQIAWLLDRNQYPVPRQRLPGLLDGLIEQRAGMQRNQMHLDYIGIDFSHFNRFADQRAQSRGLFIDDGRQVQPRGFVQALPLQQRGGRGADRGQRGAQFVGQGIDQRGAQPFSLAGGLHARRSLDRRGAGQCDGDLGAERRRHFARKQSRLPAQRSYRAQPQRQRHRGNAPTRSHQRRMESHGHSAQIGLHAHRQSGSRGVKLVLVAHVQHHALQRKDAVNEPGQVADESGRVLVQHHLLRKGVEALHVLATPLGMQGLAAGHFCHPPHHHATGCKRDQRYPLLRACQSQRAVREQEKIVETESAENGDEQRETDPGQRGRPHHQHQENHGRGRRVGAHPNQKKCGQRRPQRGRQPA